MTFAALAIEVLCVWRITHLLNAEDGPWEIVVKLRAAAGDGIAGQAMDCFYCLSLWVSLPLAWLIGRGIFERVLMWLAFSAGAILLERWTTKSQPYQAIYEEDEKHQEG